MKKIVLMIGLFLVSVCYAQTTATIYGFAYEDTNGDGVFDAKEVGMQDVVITSNDAQTTTTDSDGLYFFILDAPGIYKITETDPDGYFSTTPNEVYMTVSLGSSYRIDFGDKIIDTDSDADGIVDMEDMCQDTIPDVPSVNLKTNRWIWNGSEFITNLAKGLEPDGDYSMEDTQGCGCFQILDELTPIYPSLYIGNEGHLKFGCTSGILDHWIATLNSDCELEYGICTAENICCEGMECDLLEGKDYGYCDACLSEGLECYADDDCCSGLVCDGAKKNKPGVCSIYQSKIGWRD